MFVALYIFTLPWMYASIFETYWIRRDWNAALIGLDTTVFRKFFMLGHMTFGAFTLLLGPTQFIGPIRKYAPTVHRWCGRLYVVFAILCSIFGLIFIILKGGVLVGGINMGLAFTGAGLAFGFCAWMVYKTASDGDFQAHRAWTIRSYSQVLSPMLYRYWYGVVMALGWYTLVDSDCNAQTGICGMYFQLFDMIHCWTYWLFSLAIAELIVRALPKDEGLARRTCATNGKEDFELLNMDEENDPVASYGSQSEEMVTRKVTGVTPNDSVAPHSSALAINLVGVLVAIITVSTTTVLFSTALR